MKGGGGGSQNDPPAGKTTLKKAGVIRDKNLFEELSCS